MPKDCTQPGRSTAKRKRSGMQGVAKSITLWPSSGPKSHLWKSWARKLFTTITTHGQAGTIQDDTLSTARTRHSAARQLFERISFAKKISVIQDEHRYLAGHDKNKAYITRVRTSLIFFTFQKIRNETGEVLQNSQKLDRWGTHMTKGIEMSDVHGADCGEHFSALLSF